MTWSFTSNVSSLSDVANRVAPFGATLRLLESEDFSPQVVRANETSCQEVADSAPTMIWAASQTGAVTYVNRRWLDFTGRTFRTELGRGWLSRLHPDDKVCFTDTYNDALQRKEAFTVELRFKRSDGQYRWLRTEGAPYRSPDESFAGFVACCTDVTEQRQLEVHYVDARADLECTPRPVNPSRSGRQRDSRKDSRLARIIGNSKPMQRMFRVIGKVASTQTTVLIQGETGTGKELVAETIHGMSERSDKRLIKVNCAALPANLIESELFGHEKGAFTGATSKRIGRFELADGGTILLDEIGDLPLELQGKLLRVLQEGEFDRVGNGSPRRVDVRVIAATNRNLAEDVADQRFREDLFYRLNVFPIELPPLRDREDDIPELVEFFMRKYSRRLGKIIDEVPPDVMAQLEAYDWLGNIRELQNVIERAVILTEGSKLRIDARDFSQKHRACLAAQARTLEDVEREHILQTLDKTAWRIQGRSGAAKLLGLNPGTLRSRLKKLEIYRSGTSVSYSG